VVDTRPVLPAATELPLVVPAGARLLLPPALMVPPPVDTLHLLPATVPPLLLPALMVLPLPARSLDSILKESNKPSRSLSSLSNNRFLVVDTPLLPLAAMAHPPVVPAGANRLLLLPALMALLLVPHLAHMAPPSKLSP